MCIYHGAVKFHIYHALDAVNYLYSVAEEEETDHLLRFADRDRLRIIIKTEKQRQSQKTLISLHIAPYRNMPTFDGRIFFKKDSFNIVNFRSLHP